MRLSTSELFILESLLKQDIHQIKSELHLNELTSMYNLSVVEKIGLETRLKCEEVLLNKLNKMTEGV